MFSRSSANIARHKNNNFIIDHEAAHIGGTLERFFFFFSSSLHFSLGGAFDKAAWLQFDVRGPGSKLCLFNPAPNLRLTSKSIAHRIKSFCQTRT